MGFDVIIKFIREGIVIIVLIAAVILFSYFDPFGWFEAKPQIRSTAVLVREVKAIGELITAEYYGEALTSWPKVYQETALEENARDIKRIVNDINLQLEDAYTQTEGKKDNPKEWSERAVWKYYRRNIRDQFKKSPLYERIIKELKKKEKDVIWDVYQSDDPESILTDRQIESISNALANDQPRSERKKDAVCIGRGIVRAGIDLSKLTSDDIHIIDYSGTAYISNVTLRIIAIEMNPWFIPQREVKGFEILKTKGRIDGEDISKLKNSCREMIRQQALDRRILQEAKKNAEETLLQFFNLVRNEPLKHVRILTDHLDQLHFDFDTLTQVTPEQAFSIYNTGYRYLTDNTHSTPDTTALNEFLNSLHRKTITFPIANKTSSPQPTTTLNTGSQPLDIYSIKAFQHVKQWIALADTIKAIEGTAILPENTYIKDYWVGYKSTFSNDTLNSRAEQLKKILGQD